MEKIITMADAAKAAKSILNEAIRDFKYNPSAIHFAKLEAGMRIYQDVEHGPEEPRRLSDVFTE